MLDEQSPKRSLLAVASLTSALVVVFPPAWFAALVLGVVALVEIKQSQGRLRGRGFAITGMILSVLWTAALTWFVISALAAPRDNTAASLAPGPDEYQEAPVDDLGESAPPAEPATTDATKPAEPSQAAPSAKTPTGKQ